MEIKNFDCYIFIELEYARFGLLVNRGIVVEAAPVSAWAIGKEFSYVFEWYKTKKSNDLLYYSIMPIECMCESTKSFNCGGKCTNDKVIQFSKDGSNDGFVRGREWLSWALTVGVEKAVVNKEKEAAQSRVQELKNLVNEYFYHDDAILMLRNGYEFRRGGKDLYVHGLVIRTKVDYNMSVAALQEIMRCFEHTEKLAIKYQSLRIKLSKEEKIQATNMAIEYLYTEHGKLRGMTADEMRLSGYKVPRKLVNQNTLWYEYLIRKSKEKQEG